MAASAQFMTAMHLKPKSVLNCAVPHTFQLANSPSAFTLLPLEFCLLSQADTPRLPSIQPVRQCTILYNANALPP